MNVGNTIGPYRIVAPIGAGGMGSVWGAEHALLGTRVAIKVLLPAYSQRADIVQRFFDEARAAGRVNHPGIVQVIDFGWTPHGSAYLIMEHLAGETTAARVRRLGTVPAPRVAQIARECAITMAAAHAAGIVHRDLKPDNIFLTPDPVAPDGERVKILDFGIAKLLGQEDTAHPRTRSDVIMGTPAYMSPEQCRGAGGVDHRTDIYALGCVMFHLACGRPPFEAEAPGDLIVSHMREPAPVPSTVVPGAAALDPIIARCLAKDPAARFATMAELAAALLAATAAGMPHLTPTPGTSAPRTALPDGATVDTSPTARGAAPAAGPPTTLAASAAEVDGLPLAPRSRGLVVVALVSVATLAIVAVAVVAGGRGGRAAAPPADAGPPSPTAATDAATGALTDAATRVPQLDAPVARSAPADAALAPPDAARPPVDAAPRPHRRDAGHRVAPPDAHKIRPVDARPAPATPDANPYGHR